MYFSPNWKLLIGLPVLFIIILWLDTPEWNFNSTKYPTLIFQMNICVNQNLNKILMKTHFSKEILTKTFCYKKNEKICSDSLKRWEFFRRYKWGLFCNMANILHIEASKSFGSWCDWSPSSIWTSSWPTIHPRHHWKIFMDDISMIHRQKHSFLVF